MKKLQKYDYFINESLSKKVFHFTYLTNLDNILSENVLQSTPVMGTGADANQNKDKFYFFSTTSSRHSEIGFGASLPKRGLVRLNLNGDKLNQNYKGTRVDYWQRPKDPKDPIYKNYAAAGSKAHLKHVSRQDELEDRLMTDEPLIKNANKYIDSISVLFSEDEYRFEYDYKIMMKILDNANELDIPIYFYNNQDAFDHELTNKSVNISKLKVDEPEDEEEYVSRMIEMTRILSLLFYADEDLRDSLIKGLSKIEEFKDRLKARENTFDDFIEYIDKKSDDDRKNYLYYINDDFKKNDFPITDYISAVSNDVHNGKSKPYEHRRYITHELSKDMRKNNTKNLYEYIKYKVKLGHEKFPKK